MKARQMLLLPGVVAIVLMATACTAPVPTSIPPATATPTPTVTSAPTKTLSQPTPANPQPHIQLDLAAGGFTRPLELTHAGDGSGRLFVLEKYGTVRIIQDGEVLPTPFLDIRHRVSRRSELGLLGLAFDPDYPVNGYFYVYYTNHAEQSMIVRFQVSPDDPNVADVESETFLFMVKQPTGNHNGGQLAFGPDGHLYIGLGDGGDKTQNQNGQDQTTLLGKLLRIDVSDQDPNDGLPYDIPPDNPFVGDPEARDEIWAYGLRNPWRFSFDRFTDDLYIADVGQYDYEEVNFQPASSQGGQNYGWDIMEGRHCYHPPEDCDQTGLTLPVVEYTHDEGSAVIGGYVYRGQAIPALWGTYVFGDFGTGRIWGTWKDRGWETVEFLDTVLAISALGEDEAGELYVLDYYRGALYRIISAVDEK